MTSLSTDTAVKNFFFFLLVSRTDDPRLPPAAATATVTERTKINNYRIFGAQKAGHKMELH